jgi:uncharacterized protein DUF5020
MKFLLSLFFSIAFFRSDSQTLQLHYDMRHSIDPKRNSKNFPTMYFEYFKTQDSGKSFVKPGSFLLKMQADFFGEKNNMGKFYMQISQSFRCWKPKVFLNLQYSGGLGITEPRQYSYYIVNTYSLGISYPFKWHNSYMTSVLNYKYVPFHKPSHDFLYTLYWWQGLFKYKGEFSGDFSIWTENKNHGDDYTRYLNGKRFSFLAEPQFWYRLSNSFAAGTKVNMFYHVNTTDDVFEVYPTIAIRCKI